jgi:peptidoglycan hydrolase-like amidase/peptidoglycan hydrolase CwlO-like protein
MLIGLGVGLLHPWIWADELGDIEKQLSELQGAYEMSVSATTPLESEVARLEKQLGIIKAGIFTAEQNLQNLEEDIAKRELDLEYQIVLLQERVRSWYINRQSYSILAVFLSRNNTVGNLTHNLVYRQAAADKDKQIILSVAEGLVQLESDKMKVEQDRQRLEVVKAGASKQSVFLQGEIAKARAYQQILSNQIAELSARQQKLLAEKTGSFTTSVGEVPLADDPASRPDYDPGFRPAFAAFSFGAPHFRGLSQYGARGRAREGQNEEQILKAYYGDVRIEIRNDLPPIISTSVGNLSLEENYLLGIAEMPSDWSENNLAALKAQVIAARSYALAYVGWRIGMGGGGGSICITENCQVYKSSKAASPPENWRRAVQETRGMILVGNPGGQVVNAFYAASSGGYQESYTSLGHTTPGLWDTVCGNQGCWTGQAYERKGESPWFYKGWYKSRSGMTCGRSHPWLTEEEIADIVNSVLVYTREQSALNHVSQVDGCLGGVPETWSRDQVRQEAAKYGGPVSNIFNVEVNYSTSGVTNRVYVSTDKGGFDFSGKDFKLIFNLRAPGVVHLKSGLFNIEKK